MLALLVWGSVFAFVVLGTLGIGAASFRNLPFVWMAPLVLLALVVSGGLLASLSLFVRREK